MTHPTTITAIHAAVARDAAGVNLQPAALLIRDGVIAWIGRPGELQMPRGDVQVLDLPDTLLLPAMVNAHAHLDLTAMGPQPYGGDFGGWVGGVMRGRPTDDDAITAAVELGLKLSREAGVGWVGDIAGSDTAARAFRDAGERANVGGTAWLECFGIGERATTAAAMAIDRLRALQSTASRGVHVDLQPHAPYSAGLPLYEAAARQASARPCTHLAETLEELQFVRDATGPFADLLQRIGKWDDSIVPLNVSPVRHLARVLSLAPWVVAHCNYVTDDDIAILAATGTSVAYCPIASEYFRHANHRYRDMLAAGVNVCLATDSILCQPVDDPHPLGLLGAMRRLHQRDGTDPATLLAMATVNGASALGLPSLASTLAVGAPARLVGVRIDAQSSQDVLTQAMRSDYPLHVIA